MGGRAPHLIVGGRLRRLDKRGRGEEGGGRLFLIANSEIKKKDEGNVCMGMGHPHKFVLLTTFGLVYFLNLSFSLVRSFP